jgi:hypothetical protein
MEETKEYCPVCKTELGFGSVANNLQSEVSENELQSIEEEINIDSLDSKEKAGVKALRSMNFMRNIALSPYLYEYHNLGKPTYKTYISTSPKLQYVMECIKSVKKYHESHNEPVLMSLFLQCSLYSSYILGYRSLCTNAIPFPIMPTQFTVFTMV